jgi:hypothetical protein
VTLKSLATGAAAVAVVGAAAAGVTSIASGAPIASPQVQPVVFGVPMPLDQGDPTVGDLSSVLYGLADPSVPFRGKSYLVQGGVGILEGKTADAMMKNAIAKGYLPLSFSVDNIVLTGPGAATATVTASGPALPATTQSVNFVNRGGGWKLSRDSATAVLAAFGG